MTDLTITITAFEQAGAIVLLTLAIVLALFIVAKRMDRREADKAAADYDTEGA